MSDTVLIELDRQELTVLVLAVGVAERAHGEPYRSLYEGVREKLEVAVAERTVEAAGCAVCNSSDELR
jgi:hypothetical protein